MGDHEELVRWTSNKPLKQPLIDRPEPKARFVPSKWKVKRVAKLVRAIRRGWIKQQKAEAAGPDDPSHLHRDSPGNRRGEPWSRFPR